VAPGRTAPALERVAVNVRDFPIPDIDGLEPVDEPICDGGPDAYLSTLPIKTILSCWRQAEVPGYVSNTAGTFLCNQIFYLARHLTRHTATAVGFIHVPAAPARAAASAVPPPSMALDLVEHAVRLAALVTGTHDGPDLRLGAGAIS
jgi:pyroglutamyl-peptidase